MTQGNDALAVKMQQLVSELAQRNKELVVAAEFGSMLVQENKQLKQVQVDLAKEAEEQRERSSELLQEVQRWKRKATILCEPVHGNEETNSSGNTSTPENSDHNSQRLIRFRSSSNCTASDELESFEGTCSEYTDESSETSTPRRPLRTSPSSRSRENQLVRDQLRRLQQLEDEVLSKSETIGELEQIVSEKRLEIKKLKEHVRKFEKIQSEMEKTKLENEKLRTTIQEKRGVESLLSQLTVDNRQLKAELAEIQMLYEEARGSAQTKVEHFDSDDDIVLFESTLASELCSGEVSQGDVTESSLPTSRISESIAPGTEQSKNDPFGENFDAMFFHFHLLTQTVKMELEAGEEEVDGPNSTFGLSTEFLNGLNSQDLYDKMLQEGLPFHDWSNWARKEITRQYCTAQRDIQAFHQESPTVSKARALLEEGIISREEFQHIAKADRAIHLESQEVSKESLGACEA